MQTMLEVLPSLPPPTMSVLSCLEHCRGHLHNAAGSLYGCHIGRHSSKHFLHHQSTHKQCSGNQ